MTIPLLGLQSLLGSCSNGGDATADKSAARILMILLLAVGIIGIMFGFSRKHDKIRVEFVETGKETPFAVSMVPIGQLPNTFEVATELDISGKKLFGGLKQYVMRFDLPANGAALKSNWIQEGLNFDSLYR